MSCDWCFTVEGTAAPRSTQRTSRALDRVRLLQSTPTPRSSRESPEPPRPTPTSPWSMQEPPNLIHCESPPSMLSIASARAPQFDASSIHSSCTCPANWLSVPKLKEAATYARQLADALDDAVIQSSRELLTHTPNMQHLETSSQELEEFIRLEQKFSRSSSSSLQNELSFIPLKSEEPDSDLSKEDQLRIQQIEDKYSRCPSVNESIKNSIKSSSTYVAEFLKRIEEKNLSKSHSPPSPPLWDIDSNSAIKVPSSKEIKDPMYVLDNKYSYLNKSDEEIKIFKHENSFDESDTKNSIKELQIIECTQNLKLQLNDELKNVLNERRLRLKPVLNSSISDLSVIEDFECKSDKK